MIASAKEKDALNITLSSCRNSTNVHLCDYFTKIFVIVVNTCFCRRSVDNKAAIYPILSYPILSSVGIPTAPQNWTSTLLLLHLLMRNVVGFVGADLSLNFVLTT